ncbi:MAG: OsmC family protein [Acidobacteriota bacterium]|nr:OsmC family protein [Acidobacteriota bacterium]
MAAGRQHFYSTRITWTGNKGTGTSGYRDYDRSYEIAVDGKAAISGSSDPAFRGDRSRWNPEELLVASLSACHKLSYLHLCAEAGVRVVTYLDDAEGVMEETADGGGRFVQVTLKPSVEVSEDSDLELAVRLHEAAHHICFIARSVNFPVTCTPNVQRLITA